MTIRILILIVLSSTLSSELLAQGRGGVNFDTITMSGVRAGEPVRDLIVRLSVPIDTMLWGGEDGASLLRFTGKYFGLTGEFRVATQGSIIHQISFSVQAKDSNDAARNFENLDALIEKKYGNPNEGYTNIFKMIRWNGKKQSLLLQTKEGTAYVSVSLRELEQKRPAAR